MKLASADVDIFYQIQSSLYSFVNQQRGLFPELKTLDDVVSSASLEQIDALRQALYADISLLDAFVAANPHNLPASQMETAHTWRHFKAGTFYIFRYLKKYTVFLDDSTPPKAYGVLGLHSDFDEILPMRPPIMVKAVLLPFGEHIVFDGLLKPYNIYFGGNIRRRLNGEYRNAKERFGIITSLLQQPEGDPATIQAGNKRVLKAFSQRLAGAGLRPQTIEKHITNVRRFEANQPPCPLHEATVADVRDYFSRPLPPDVEAKGSITSLKKFFRFMIDSGRMFDAAYDILDDLKDHGDEYIAAPRKGR